MLNRTLAMARYAFITYAFVIAFGLVGCASHIVSLTVAVVARPAATPCAGFKCIPRAQASAAKRKANGKSGGRGKTSTDQSKPITETERTIQAYLFFIGLGFFGGMIACQLLRFWMKRCEAEKFHPEWLFVGLALLCLVGHTVFVDTKLGLHWEPSFDTTTLLWLSAAAAGLLYPQISKITFGTFGLELQRKIEDVSDLVTEALTITNKWAWRLNDALYTFPQMSPTELPKAVSDFLSEAATDATLWLGKDGEYRRLAYWMLDKNGDLALSVSNDITPQKNPAVWEYHFKPGTGLAWLALNSRDPVNVDNASRASDFVRIPGDRTRYFGMLVVAVRCGKERLGVISVDRSLKEKFPKESVELIEALAAMTGMLLGEPRIRKNLNP